MKEGLGRHYQEQPCHTIINPILIVSLFYVKLAYFLNDSFGNNIEAISMSLFSLSLEDLEALLLRTIILVTTNER